MNACSGWLGQRAGWAWAVAAAVLLSACGGGGGGGAAPEPVNFALAVSTTGGGSVSSSTGGINCGNSCTANLPAGTRVTLTALPAADQQLQGWSGACSGQALTCEVTMDAARSASASFVPVTRALEVSVSGNGSLRSAPAGIDCGGGASSCSASFNINTSVTLTATPAAGQVLQGWGGACSGQTASCTLSLDVARSVSATFAPMAPSTFMLDVSVSGSGSLSSDPAGISCGSTCSARFNAGSAVTLTATPAAGQRLRAWGGACSGSASTCSLTMDAARSASATFEAVPAPAISWAPAALLESSNDFNVAGTSGSSEARMVSDIDSSGNALVVWEQPDGTPDGGTRKVFSRRYVAGQGWAAAVQVPSLSSASSAEALVTGQLLAAPDGSFIWVRHNFETRRYSAGGGWSTSAFSPPAGIGGLIDAKIDASGLVHVLSYGGGELHSNRLPAGSSSWGSWAKVAATDGTSPRARIALQGSDGLIAIWREINSGDGNYSMKANRWSNGSWGTPVRIEEVLSNVNDANPALATDSAGNALAVWHQGNSLYLNRFDASSGSWGTATEVDAGQVDSFITPSRIRLAMLPDGRAVAVWGSGAGLPSLKSMAYTPGSGWSAPLTAAPYAIDRFIGLDSTGRALVVYRGVVGSETAQSVYSRELPWGGSSWTAAAALESGGGEVKFNVACAMNLSGQAVCTWAQDDLPNDRIRNSLWGVLRR